ncbi:MAG: phosphate butyryltransferase [Spirochaetaceae bacterium]|jgi:phosphate butyryltransferase|nr:phosphate butyryltransferase [Spirochaetaceae bacterium]
MLKTFDSLTALVRDAPKRTVVVASANDGHTLEAVLRASREGLIDYILVGNRSSILAVGEEQGADIPQDAIVDAGEERDAAEKAVALVRQGHGNFLMKGKLQTATLMRAVIDKNTGMRGENVMSHLALFELPGYPKLLGVTDGGMIPYPTLEQKEHIIKNAAVLFEMLGYQTTKVAVLAASETVNERMPETEDARILKERGEKGGLGDCFVEGPVSLDLALSRESAVLKGYESPITGDADILVVPNIACGNILGKSLIYAGNAKMAGCIVGAAVPVVLTSRGASTEEKHLSILLCAAASTARS